MGKFALKAANRALHRRLESEGPSAEDLAREQRNIDAMNENIDEFSKAIAEIGDGIKEGMEIK